MKKGFTLIELLAVIVILAIIVVIATPIVLSIIKNSKVSSNVRSAESYLDAVENAILKENLGGKEFKPLSCTVTSDDGKTLSCNMSDNTMQDLNIDVSGKTVESGALLNFTKGSVTAVANLKIDGEEIPSTSLGLGTVIYRWTTDTININQKIDGLSDYTLDPTTLNKRFYLKHVLDKDNIVIESYACAIFNNAEYCVRGGSEAYFGYDENEADYTGNTKILNNLQANGINCRIREGESYCNDDFVRLGWDSNGYVMAGDDNDNYYCYVYNDGDSYCRHN